MTAMKQLEEWVNQYRDEMGLADHAAVEAMDHLLKAWGRHGLESGSGVDALGGAANCVGRVVQILQAFQGRLAIMAQIEKDKRKSP